MRSRMIFFELYGLARGPVVSRVVLDRPPVFGQSRVELVFASELPRGIKCTRDAFRHGPLEGMRSSGLSGSAGRPAGSTGGGIPVRNPRALLTPSKCASVCTAGQESEREQRVRDSGPSSIYRFVL